MAKRIRIKLLMDKPGMGQAGDVVEVKPGFMRNELYPKGVAEYVIVYTGPRNRQAEAEQVAEQAREKAIKSGQLDPSIHRDLYIRLRAKADRIESLSAIEFVRPRIRPNDSAIFGSVSADDILNQLRSEYQVELDPNSIEIERIKALGQYTCQIQIPHLGKFPLKVKVKAPQA
ncbi:hypothetical protein SYNPS1DRAFT_29312 [Syncephalis pseudoplumigaleata]|uniref:50S ribosomal protein L9, chloroplastic n=2 Tax=Zoopagomycota TaxID=1913638 RepID=A0A4Q0A162_9FUNG|nr:hypothetical protein SYNPS1DRAFT_29312 [Syncephalis pseudoplumigaleata]RKP39813.1 hypothetical protein BJ085DRAFT_30975 [Dimargaris cristalligena]|eukprot:RKP24944.1 hypothetical protein SYNPS1DRAFT_29312 [Syncephalis pseudoplumigaleata]